MRDILSGFYISYNNILKIILLSVFSYKSMKFRRLINGNSLILLDNGELYKKNFKTAKLDINEFLEQCRTNGYFNLNDIQTAILESNGKISFLPKPNKMPLTLDDMNLTTTGSSVFINLIIDGHVLQENLDHSGHDLLWLNNELGKKNISDVSEVFLAMCDTNNQLIVYKQNSLSNSHDYFD